MMPNLQQQACHYPVWVTTRLSCGGIKAAWWPGAKPIQSAYRYRLMRFFLCLLARGMIDHVNRHFDKV
jgi:hypothetical protein